MELPLLIMRLELLGNFVIFLVLGVFLKPGNGDDDGFNHFIGNDQALECSDFFVLIIHFIKNYLAGGLLIAVATLAMSFLVLFNWL